MTNSTLRKLVIIVSSVAALAGGVGIDTAYARGGGGFGGGHMGGSFGGGHERGGGFCAGHMGGEFGGGRLGGVGIAHMGGGSLLGTEHVGAPAENHVGALAGVHFHPGAAGLRYHPHRRWLGYYTWGPRCDHGTDAVMADPDCRLPY